MTPENYAMLQEWLKEGDNIQRQHAKYRLSLPDAVNYEAPNPVYPSVFRQAKNIMIAAGSVASSFIHGEPIAVSRKEQNRRFAICELCEKFDAKQERCTVCGCYEKVKTWLTSEHCPIGKW